MQLNGSPVKMPSRRAGWLLALLVLREGQPINRETVATTLWPESTDAGALHNLRQTLAGLRKALGESGKLLQGESGRSLVWKEAPDSWIDVRDFDAALKSGERHALEQACDLYTGPLVADCDEPFAEEARSIREVGLLAAIDRLCEIYESEGELKSAIPLLKRAQVLDPYRDASCRMLMKALAASSETASIHEAYRNFSRQLRRDLDIEPDAETRELYRLLRKSNRTGRTIKTLTASRRTLPSQISEFIGRAADLQEVSELVTRCRLVTLAGIGGTGKTRLALEVAGALEDSFADGARFVDLSPVTESTSIQSAFAGALDVSEKPAVQLKEALAEYLRHQEVLIVVDNCEHLQTAVAELLDFLLSQSPGLHILTTSRQTLGVAGEWVWRVPTLSEVDSTNLFLARAAQVGSLRNPSPTEVQEVTAICTTLDCLPLAIELAASRTKVMTVSGINVRLKDRFAFLSTGLGGQSSSKTLEAAIEWSWDLLTKTERKLLICLATFRGGAILSAITAVFGMEEQVALDTLTSLVDKSLVIPLASERGMRFSLLETIRQFVESKMKGKSDWDESLGRHRDFFLNWLITETPEQNTPTESLWFRNVESEHDNFRAALEWSHASRDGEKMLQFVTRLSRFWDTFGHVSEGRERVERALREAPADTSERLIALARGNAAWMAIIQGDPLTALEHHRASLPYFRSAGDDFELAFVLNTVASATYATGDFETARSEFGEALAIFRRIGRAGGIAAVLNNLGELELATGETETARSYLKESLEVGGGLHDGNPERRGLILCNLAVADLRQDRMDEAESHVLFATRLFADASVVVSMPVALGILAIVEGKLRNWKRSAWLLGASEGLASAQGVPLPKLTFEERALTEFALGEELGPAEFEEKRREGKVASLESAVAFALQ